VVIVVAIDGPAGAGKSTVARAVAARLDRDHLDTGAMYRAVTFAALRDGIDVADVAAVAAASRSLDLAMDDGTVVVDGTDATQAIRSDEVTRNVSAVAANSGVRAELVRRQRAWVDEHGGGVIEGRDIGSIVFPEATLKVYVTASPQVRAQRRSAESGSLLGDLDEIEAAIAARDLWDSTRDDSPLRRADDAHLIDTSERTVDDIVEEIVRMLG